MAATPSREDRFNFLSNGDIFDMGSPALLRSTTVMPDVYVGHIDSDGDIRLDGDYDQPGLEASILAELRAQFVARIHGNWPRLTDWPIELLRAIDEERGPS